MSETCLCPTNRDNLADYIPCPAHDETAENDATFVGSSALLTALHETYVEHIGIVEPDGPDGHYIWCACGWRSDNLGPNNHPGNSYAVHLANAQHAAAVKALQPIVTRVTPPALDGAR